MEESADWVIRFREACSGRRHMHMHLILYLIDKHSITRETILGDESRPFVGACRNGRFKVVRWLLRKYGPEVAGAHGGLALAGAVGGGHLRVAEYLVAELGLGPEQLGGAVRTDALAGACAGGHLAAAQWLVEKFSLSAEDARAEDNYILRSACANGRLETAQWLTYRFALGPEDGRSADNEALDLALKHGHDFIVLWPVSAFGLDPGDLRKGQSCPLRRACLGGDIRVASWIFEIFPPGLGQGQRSLGRRLLLEVCSSGRGCLGVVELVAEKFRLTRADIEENSYEVLRVAAVRGPEGAAKWLTRRYWP